MKTQINIFSADECQTALGRKNRKRYFVNVKKEECNYCEGKRYDIFNKTEPCPFCDDITKEELIDEKIRLNHQYE